MGETRINMAHAGEMAQACSRLQRLIRGIEGWAEELNAVTAAGGAPGVEVWLAAKAKELTSQIPEALLPGVEEGPDGEDQN